MIESPLMDFETADELDLNLALGSTQTASPTFSEKGATEMAMLTASLVGQDAEGLKSEYQQGINVGVTVAKEALSGIQSSRKLKEIEQQVQQAQTPEEVAIILDTSKDAVNRSVSMLDFRQHYIVEQMETPSERVPYIAQTIAQDAYMAQEIAKKENAIWEETSMLGLIGDFAELVLPTSTVTEEYNKFDMSLEGALEKISQAPKEKQMEVFESIVDTWSESETLLIGNNNSLIVADQLQGLREAIYEGGLGLLEGEITEAQAQDRIETALNATILGYEAKSIGKGLKGLMKWMTTRIFPSNKGYNGVDESERIVYNTREMNTSDIIKKEKPIVFKEQVAKEGLIGVAKKEGIPPEDFAMKLIPTPSPKTDRGLPNPSSQVNELILMDKDAVSAGILRGIKLQKDSGNTLTLQESATAIVNNTDENSLGDFKLLFGNGDDGFESAQEAEKAMQRGLIGVDKKQVVERDGKWFVEAEQKHIFDAKLDTGDLGVDLNKVTNKLEFAYDPLRRLGEDVLKGVFALKSYNRSIAQKMQDELSDIFSKDQSALARSGMKPMSAEDTNTLTKALEYTDQDGVDWIKSVDDYATVTGTSIEAAGNTWKRYQRVQKLMDNIWQIRNDKYRKSLLSQGVKDVKIGDETLRGTPQSKVDSPVVDMQTKELVSPDEIPEGFVPVRLMQPIQDEAGELRRLVLVKADDVKELPAKVLTQRAGHLDRFYREAGWTVKIPKKRIVDGVEEKYSSTTHIVKSEKEAKEIVKQISEESGEEAVAVRARENDDLDGIFGETGSAQYGYSDVHSKQRGDVLKGSDGMPASTSGIIESLSRTVSGVERQLDVDIVNSLKSRFLKQFEPYLKKEGGPQYNTRFEEMFNTADIPREVLTKAKQWHNYIQSISKVQQGEWFSWIDNTVKDILKLNVDSQKMSSVAQNFTTQMVIVGRPLFQIPQNFFQLTYVAEKYGTDAFAIAPKLPSAISALRDPTTKNIDVLAKSLGVDSKQAKELVQDMRDNGLWDAIGMSDDFMRMVQKSSVDATPTKLGNALNITKNSIMSPFSASKAGQEGVLKLVNLTAYLAEYRKQVIKGGRPFNGKTKADINFNVQKITQTQNSVNQFKYQAKSSLASPMFQFMQHVHKLYLDVIIDPVLKITKDPIMLALGKEVPQRISPLASSYMQASASLIATYAVFGPQGVFGNIIGSKVEDVINNIENPIAKEVLQGNMVNEIINSTVNFLGAEGNVDFSSKIHPASFLDTFYEYHIESFFQEGTVNFAGAVGYMGGVIGDTAKAIVAITDSELEWDEKSSQIISEVMRTVAGVSDFEKAYIAYHLGNYVYKSSLSGNLAVTPYEAIMQLGNFNPASIQDRWAEFSSSGKTQDNAVKSISKVYSRMMHRELAEADGFDEMLGIASKYSAMLQNSVDPLQRSMAMKELSRSISEVGDKTYLDYLKPYMNQKKLSDVIYELRSLKEDASTDEMRKVIDSQIEVLTPMVEEIQKVHGE